ncbi:hypothetical protein ACFL6I_09420 [candidate division KSB1 bacterium]
MSAKSGEKQSETVLELKLLSEKILETQVHIQHEIGELKASLFNPDEGLYARVCRNTQFRMTASRWLWILTTGLTFTVLNIIYRFFTW